MVSISQSRNRTCLWSISVLVTSTAEVQPTGVKVVSTIRHAHEKDSFSSVKMKEIFPTRCQDKRSGVETKDLIDKSYRQTYLYILVYFLFRIQ